MIDKVVSVPREAIGRTLGRADSTELHQVAQALLTWLAI
jgi:mRNA-degrading endonuclease toxin of MazEF toxin-antitoxin module